MSAALVIAARLQVAIDELTVKGRPAGDEEAEERLSAAAARALAPVLDSVAGYASRHGVPADDVQAKAALGDLEQVEAALLEVLEEHVGGEAAEAIASVERAVAAAEANKQLPDSLRPYGMDRKLFATLSRLGGRMLRRFTSRTLDALTEAADVALPQDQLRGVLGEMLDGELRRLSRHTLGDARGEATVAAEQALGVRRHRWRAVVDEDSREGHAAIDGEVVEVGERFSNGWKRPGGVGCRCWLEPVLEEG